MNYNYSNFFVIYLFIFLTFLLFLFIYFYSWNYNKLFVLCVLTPIIRSSSPSSSSCSLYCKFVKLLCCSSPPNDNDNEGDNNDVDEVVSSTEDNDNWNVFDWLFSISSSSTSDNISSWFKFVWFVTSVVSPTIKRFNVPNPAKKWKQQLEKRKVK